MGQSPNTSDSNRRRKRGNASKGRRRLRTLGRIAAWTVGGLVVAAIGGGVGYAAVMLRGLPKITPDTFTNNSEASVVYDRNGQVLYRFTRNGDYDPITSTKDVSPWLVDAFVAAEDKTFFTNIGINPLAMLRAAVQDVMGHRIESGASTITQQTVKLALFPDQERTIKRKVQEIFLALEVNHMLSKDEIMTDYMNWVFMGRMGSPTYGVKTASEMLFHKDPKDLNLAEAAFLAAIPNNPNYYDPYRYTTDNKVVLDPSHAIERQRWILGQMKANGMITEQQYEQALQFDIRKDLHPISERAQAYPYVIQDNVEPLVVRALVSAGIYQDEEQADEALSTAGFQIYTTIDKSIQDHVDAVLSNDSLFKGTNQPVPNSIPNHENMPPDLYQAGVTMIDNQTGGIVALAGGRPNHYYASNGVIADQIDHSDTPRQTGSAIKPLIDYGPAIELHRITAATPLLDGPWEGAWPGGSRPPQDDEPGWRGIVTAREALVQSYNLPAIRVLQTITPDVGMSFLPKMGITTSSTTIAPVGGKGQPTLVPADVNNSHLSAAIGAFTYGLTVQQMTSAFTVFPNQGVWRQPYIVAKITDRNGQVLYEHKPQADVAFSPQTAYILTNIMEDVVRRGTASAVGAAFPGQHIAGKTGTTDLKRDGWFIGFTQQYTLGIWMGYNHNQRIPDAAYNLKFTIWNQIMQPILKQHPATKPFPEPPGIVSVAVCSKSGQLPTALCQQDHDVYTELFIQGTQPMEPCAVHVQAQYTVIDGKKYLATTNTPPDEVLTGIFLKPPFPVPTDVVMSDSAEYLPTLADPRGGTVLTGGSGAGIAPPGAPQNVTGAVVNGQVQLQWSDSAGATAYQVWRATSPNGPFRLMGSVTSTHFVDTQIPPGIPVLYYEVAALSANGVSKPSDVVAVPTGEGGSGESGNSTNSTGENSTGNTAGGNASAGGPEGNTTHATSGRG
ncbi:MAG: transglycosylase domain-containing protein [Thermoflavifilum sp.]|nr:transglycosylase domain-containing protein [Thermoflavifilum sp.]MCL6512819.1 transglycosylase domain-containing protein [Alicyclobacillus sp.]